MGWNTKAYRKYRNSAKAEKTRSNYHASEAYAESHDKYMSYAAKRRANRKGLDFTITIEHIVFPETCPLLGIKINFVDFGVRVDSPSLDRKDSLKGYTPCNVWVISTRANILKTNATVDELETLAKNWRLQCGSI